MKRPRYFQWLEGDLAGTVSVLDYIECVEGEYFYNFADGETCNLRFISQMTNDINALKGKVMVEIANPNDMWISEDIKTHREKVMDPTYGEQSVEVPPIEDMYAAAGNGDNISLSESKLGKRKYKAPRYKGPFTELPSLDDYYKNEEEDIQKQMVEVEKHSTPVIPTVVPPMKEVEHIQMPIVKNTISETDPVRILAKTSKKHPTDVEMTITIDLPNVSVYNIAEDEFEDGGDKFIECLIENVNVNTILDALRNSLKTAYMNASSKSPID